MDSNLASQPQMAQSVLVAPKTSRSSLFELFVKNNSVLALGGTIFSLGLVIFSGGLNSPFFFTLYLVPLLARVNQRLINPLGVAILESLVILTLFLLEGETEALAANYFKSAFAVASPVLAGYLVTWRMKKIASLQLAKEKLSSEKEIMQYLQLLSAEKAQLEEVLHSIDDGVLVTDKNGQVFLASRKALELLNTALAKIKGKIIEEVLPLGNLKEGKINLRSLDGEISHINVRNFPLKDENNQVKGEIYVLRDVTKADQLEEMKLDFVSSVAHQLRTPITTIRSYLAVLSESVVKKLETEDRELLNRAMIVVNQLATLVENLLNVMKIEKGRLNVEAKPLSLEPIIEETIAALAVIAQQQEVKLTFENPPADFPKVKGDSYLIKEVLTNLIINGINFNHRGGWVIISLQKESQSVIVHIRDNGKGIPPQSIPYLFNRFYKVSNEYIMESKGVGLGLYISQAIVQALGGKIWVNSIEGKGTTFSFSLSLAV